MPGLRRLALRPCQSQARHVLLLDRARVLTGRDAGRKEEITERRLWVAYSSLEEIAIIIEHLEASGFALSDPEGYRRRGAVARSQAKKIRSAIESDRPLIPRAAEDHFVKDPP